VCSDTGECARKFYAGGGTDFARWKSNPKSASLDLQAQVNSKIGRIVLAKSAGQKEAGVSRVEHADLG